jgi:hypothetical protein
MNSTGSINELIAKFEQCVKPGEIQGASSNSTNREHNSLANNPRHQQIREKLARIHREAALKNELLAARQRSSSQIQSKEFYDERNVRQEGRVKRLFQFLKRTMRNRKKVQKRKSDPNDIHKVPPRLPGEREIQHVRSSCPFY